MSCVNTSSKEFKSLLSKVNVSSGTLELLIHKLQNDNENAPYPTPSEVIAKLSPKAFTSNADMIHAWVNNYSKPRYFRTKDEAEFFFMEDAIRIFGKDSVSLTQTKDGGYIAEVGRPDILPFSLNNGIWSELKNTLKEGPKDALLKAFIEVFEINGRLPIVDISSLPNTEYISANGIKTNGVPLALGGRDSIIFDTNALLSLMSKTPPSMREKVFKQYFLHELTHSVTLAAIDKVEAGKGTKEEKVFYDEINRIYNIAKEAMGKEADSYYGMDNIKEFLAEITSNLSFQKRLASIKDTKKKNLWNTIIDAFTSFFNKYFNMNIKDSVLESGLISLSEYIQYAKNNSTSIEATPTELASKVNSVTPGTFLTFNSLSDLQRFLQNEGFTVGVGNSNRTEAEAHIIGKHKYNGAYWLKQWTDESLTSNTNVAKNLLNKVLSNLGIADKGVVTIKDTDNGTIVEFHKEAFEKAKEEILENIQDRDYYENSLLSESEQYDLEVLDSVDSELSSLVKEGKLSIYEAKDLFEQKNGISIYYQSNPDMAFSQAPSNVQYQSNTQNDTNNYSSEEQGIIDKAKKDGTFMKAPNGKYTNLTERQWVQVRTKAFKDWFGDWEKGLIVQQDDKSYYRGQYDEPIIDKDGNLRLKGRRDDLYNRAGYNIDKGVSAATDMVTANKYGETRYLAYIGGIEDKYGELDNSWEKEEEINEIIEHGYYLIQFPKNISNEVIKEAGEVKLVGDVIIPKGQYTIEHITDEGTEVLAISNNNASKVVDENGEPLVVYRAGEINEDGTLRTSYEAYYFTPSKRYAEQYKEQYVEQENVSIHSFFLKANSINNIVNGARPIIRSDGKKVPKRGLFEMPWSKEDVNIILEGKEAAYSDGEYLIPNSNQIKSATDNVGTFSRTDDRIDYFETNNSEKVAESQEALDILKKEGITLDNSLIDKYLLEVKASNPYHQIFKQIVGILNNNNIPINIVVNSNLSNIAARKQDGFKTATIEINPALLLDYLMTDNKDNIKENLMKILTHELVHAVTAEILNYHPSWAKIKNFNEAQTEFSNNVWNLYLQCKEQLKGTEWYGLTNAKEFIAVALTDRDFQIELSKIKLDKNENAFKRFINYLTDLFNKVFKAQGIDIRNSALEEIISISQEYFNSANKNLRGGIYDYTGTRDYYDNDVNYVFTRTAAQFTLEDFEVKVPDGREVSGGTIGIANGKYVSFHTIEGAFQAAKLNYLDNVSYTEEEFKKVIEEGKDSNTILKKLGEARTTQEVTNIVNEVQLDKGLNTELWNKAAPIIRKALEDKYEKYLSSQNDTTLNFKPEEAEFYSGAAIGSDKAWEEAATKAGIKVKNYTVNNWDKLSNEERERLDKEYQEVVNTLGRKVLDINSYSGKLVRRDMLQADKADAIFAVGTVASNGYVDGGTGYATTRGIIRGIPVYLFDQSDSTWKVWNKEQSKFIPTIQPSLTKNAAVVGTRNLQNNGREAINNIFTINPQQSFQAINQQTTQSTWNIISNLNITPANDIDKKAAVKGAMANKFIGFAEGIPNSSTGKYAKQAGDKANTGNYTSNDVIFVSIPGKRGNEDIRHQQQDRTIAEALKALRAGATLLTDNKVYTENSTYNEGEKRLAKALNDAGAVYSEIQKDNQTIGVWAKPQQEHRVEETTENKIMEDAQEEAPQTDKTEKEQDLYTTKQQDKMQQIDNLLGDNLLSATEVRHIAEQAVYWISDHITELQENPELAKTIYGDRFKNEDGTDKDFASMTRADVVRTIGVDNIVEMCKQKFSPEHNDFDNDDTLDKAFAITDNWQAIMLLAQDSFLNVEDFSIVSTPDGKANEVNEDLVGDADNFNESNDQLDVEEIEGSLQEHWQIESRCQDVLGTMSQIVKRALLKCYILDKDGNNVQSEFGINERINVREATNSILRWTQGSLSLADMVTKLQEKQEDNPWVKQLINRLSDTSGKETDFQGQFYGTFSKHFQPYSVVIEEDGKYKSIQVNENPALSEAMTQVTTQYKIGEHPLFTTDGINKESFKELRAAYDSLEKFRHMGYDLSKEVNKDEAANTLGYISNLFGYYVTPDMVKSNLTSENYKKMYSALGYIVKSFENNLDNASYEPFKFKAKDSINGNMREFLKPITEQLEDIAVSAFYDSGKMYQSYVTPSYMSKLMQKFSQNGEAFDKFLTEEFGNQPWFHEGTDIERGWRNSWLRALATDSKAREIFKHKVQLNFNKHNYMKNMSDMEYTLSLFTEYFSEGANDKQSRVPAWFRVPMLSNKPSSEFIRFYSERGTNYRETITDGMMDIFNQELSRIQTVLMRNLDSKDPRFIKNFDKNGKKFCFLDFMNDYLTGDKKNSELGKLINDKVNGKEVDEAKLYELANKAIFDAMDARAKAIVEKWIDSGLMEGAKKITGIGVTEEEIKSNLENFVWNDTFAAMNIMELTVTDIAYYKNAEDLQKRLAQIHAPGIRGNIEATDYEGRKVSDGKERTFYLTDWDNFVSNIIDNVSIVFDRKIAEATEAEKAGYRALKESLVGENGAFRNINVADAQGYSSPTSYRKKAFIFGKWSKKAEDIYQKLRKGDYNYNDLSIAFQPLKPFVYSQIEKSSGVSNTPLDKFKVPVQNKNSEYLLIMADAILQNENTGRPNLLRAIYEVMEESHYDEDGNYKTDGIDTVQFESTVKSGLMGRINLNKYVNDANGEAKAKAVMKACLYETIPKTVQEVNPETGELEDIVINTKTDKYSQTYVHELPFEDYCLQQEVPEHFKNHEQVHGSQLRYIVVSELATKDSFGNDATYEVEGRKVSADEFKAEYEQTIADNIEDSINELESALALHSTNARDRNIALSKILQREILSSPRYGVDLLQACSVDENGRFRIPLGDPIQSKRVEQLINSIIKNRVNKQEIAGGPVVQVTNFGTSRELNIRFKDKNGGLLMTRAEYEKNPIKKELSQTDKFNAKYKGLKTSKSIMSYEDYIKENQGGIAYFEVFAPIYANNLFSQFADKNGNISIEALEALDPDLLKMIGYRIPTEAKYSMAPLKIVGFLPREAGDGIMLPNDITLLTGSDFDKFYVEIKMC